MNIQISNSCKLFVTLGTLVEKGKLDTLKVPELDKYIMHNKLSKTGRKNDKIKRITVHYCETSKESTFPSSISVGEDSQ